MTKKKVLLIGIDPKLIDFSKVTTANITLTLLAGAANAGEAGSHCTNCSA